MIKKTELINLIHDRTHLSKTQVQRVLDALIDTTVEALERGEDVGLTGLGSFVVQQVQPRNAHDFNTGRLIQIPARRRTKFKPSNRVKEIMRQSA